MHKVELEFKRIQTYLFSSPRLRAMLGANSTLGETIRIKLVRLANKCGSQRDSKLANQLPLVDSNDPLSLALEKLTENNQEVLLDNPAKLYEKYGVLVRDGGHFIATFSTTEQAKKFTLEARKLITQNLPGILLESRLDGIKEESSSLSGEDLFQHPGFQVSHNSGKHPAEKRNTKGLFISHDEAQLEDRGATFRNHPNDLIGILEQAQVIPRADLPPQSPADLTSTGYIALIHADGNSIGKRYQGWRNEADGSKDGLDAEIHGEKFFHSMRVTVRKALVDALNQIFRDAPQRYQLLMLGGDDLLLACSAEFALPFVVAYAQALKDYPLVDKKPLDVGVGVAIAKESFPFYRLHSMAEALADSAKRLSRISENRSVVDWHISSNSWVDDPITERRSECLLAGTATVLSGKPYLVLDEGAEVNQRKLGLESLLEQVGRLAEAKNKVARSQLRQLVNVMRQGATLAELAWAELPQSMREALKELSYSDPFDHNGISLLQDLIEISEIAYLGQSSNGKEIQK